MSSALDFLRNCLEKLTSLTEMTKNLFRQEELLKNNLLVKSGFLIRRYSLRYDRVTPPMLQNLRTEVQRIKEVEKMIALNLRDVQPELKSIEREYEASRNKKLRVDLIFTQYLNNALQMQEQLQWKLEELSQKISSKSRLRPQNETATVQLALESIERMMNQILKFADVLRQLTETVLRFEQEDHYDTARAYGRCMSPSEAKLTLAKKELIGSPKRKVGDLVAVFDAPSSIVKNISRLSNDEQKNFFGSIGVIDGTKVIYFQTKLKPLVGPVTQSNGLREYKFAKGIPIEELKAA